MTASRTAKLARFAAGSLLAASMLAGCTTGHAPRAETSVAKAQLALAKGQAAKAIPLAEAAVLAAPRDANNRALLGHAYLKAGRFDSAVTAFNDAMSLGDNSARTALSLSLSYIGAGRHDDAVALLDDWRESIPASDLGLALSLAGQPERGSAILADALRAGDNSAKMRQNLAYSYALAGRWREARVMAAQDVPADKIDARIGEWAAVAQPEAFRARVAALLSVPLRGDPGQPAALALSNTPSAEQLAAESGALKPEPRAAAAAELPPVDGQAEPAVATAAYAPPAPAAAAPVEPAVVQAPVAQSDVAASYASQPVVQPLRAAPAAQPNQSFRAAFKGAAATAPVRAAPVRAAAPAPVRAVAAAAPAVSGTHLVQLGSFSSPQGARRAWGIFAARNPELKSTRMTITPAVVRGKHFWRVAAAGLNAGGASGLCSTVKTRGGVCFAYAAVPSRATGVPGTPAREVSGPMRARRR